jgi:hypothetical protein
VFFFKQIVIDTVIDIAVKKPICLRGNLMIHDWAWVHAQRCKLQKGCTRLAAASDKVYQLFAHGRWFSPGIPASSTTKTGRHDIAEIVLLQSFD